MRRAAGQRFRDRREAGRELARRLAALAARPRTVVLGLPRGGVVPAAEIATALGLPLDVLLSRKLRAPGYPELAIGAVAEGGDPFFYEQAIASTGASAAWIEDELARQREEIAERQRRFRGGRPLELPAGATVILVDDGVATGSTVIAAVRALRGRGVDRLVLALPVAPEESAERLRSMVDELVVLRTPADFTAVGCCYDDFTQVDDHEVQALLRGHAQRHATTRSAVARSTLAAVPWQGEVRIESGTTRLHGDLVLPARAQALVIFAHGSGSSRHSPRNRAVAALLQRAGLATLLLDLLGADEAEDSALRFDIDLLAKRVLLASDWARRQPRLASLPLAYFGASTGAAAALVAAASCRHRVAAVVSRGGRPDLAGRFLGEVRAPTLLVVGGDDHEVLRLNRDALAKLHCPKRLEIVDGATHLFEEAGALEQVAALARDWFLDHRAAAAAA